jgi:ketosteroid isomerase-like protein
MPRKFIALLALTILAVSPALAQAPRPVPGDQRPGDRDAIRAHIMSIFAAFKNRDRAALRATHARHWRGYLWDSHTVIKGIDSYLRYVEPALDGDDPEFELPEFDVLFYGDMAIVNFTADMVLADGTKRPWLRITDIYVKEAGGWNQAASNTDQHPAARDEQMSATIRLPEPAQKSLLAAREAVWRSWFAGDTKRLTELLPEDTIAINSGGEEEWPGRDAILESSRQFAAAGNKLVRLEFPRTEIRAYGRTAVIYTTYLFEIETAAGQRSTSSGRATEFFVLRNGKWLNPGWHMDSGK